MTTVNNFSDVLSIGEALIDFISTEPHDRLADSASFQAHVGGQPLNVAVNISKLGYPVKLVATVGQDGLGDKILSHLASNHVDTKFIKRSITAPTSLALITRKLSGTPDFVIYRGADPLINDIDTNKLLTGVKVIHTSAFALSREPARSAILNIIQQGKQNGCMITFDPNYHPLIHPDTTEMVSIIREVIHLSDVIKPSLDDCQRLFGSGMKPEQYIENLTAWGAQAIILTMGKQGAILRTPENTLFTLNPISVPSRDVTGAGDAFWAGLISGLLKDMSLLDAARLGQIVALHKIQTMGPINKFPQIEALIEESRKIGYTAHQTTTFN